MNKKLFFILVFLTFTQICYSQGVLDNKVSINISDQSLKNAVEQIEQNAGVSFTYKKGLLERPKRVNVNAANVELGKVLEDVFQGTNLTYKVIGKQIILVGKVLESTDNNKTVSKPAKKKINNGVVTGIVTDFNNEVLIGASVSIEGTTIGTLTDVEGKYSLKIPKNVKNKILLFSYVGFERQRIAINDQSVINASLSETILEEVVVVGYGTMKKSDLTGSVASIKAKASDATQFNTVDDFLRGRAAGIQVLQSGGGPGGAISVRIRGLNSFRGNNEPLYVVDGVIINNVSTDNSDPFASKTSNSGQGAQSGLTGINPQDIESIEILKDASATAIYGSRGSNGVVIVSTKQGKGKPKVSFNSTFEVSQTANELPMLDARSYAEYINLVEQQKGRDDRFGLDTLVDVNWQRELQQTALNHNSRLVVSGSSNDEDTRYYLAAGFQDMKGVIQNSDLRQGDLKLNFSQKFNKKFKIDLTLSGITRKTNMSLSSEPLGSSNSNLITKMLVGNPILNANVDLDDPSSPYDNPLSWLSDYDDLSTENRILAGISGTYQFNKSLSYRVRLAGDYRIKERKRWFGKKTFFGRNANGSLGLSTFERTFYQLESLLLFKKDITKKVNFNGTVGVTYDNENIASSSVINEDFFTEELRTDGFGFGSLLYPYIRDQSEVEVFSILARTNFNFGEKYLLTLSGRADGTSKFSSGNKFSYFPAVAFATRFDENDFIQNSSLLNSMKWRIGYGRSGNQAITPYGTFARFAQTQSVLGNAVTIGTTPSNIQNEDLRWETTDQFNSGIDIGFKNNKYLFTADVYYKRTYDLLQSFSLPSSSGFERILKNIGTIENRGIEFSGLAHVINTSDFKFDLNANISFNETKILDLGLEESNFGIFRWEAFIGEKVSNGTYFKEPANIFVVGQPIGLFYGYQTDGVFQQAEETTNVLQFGLPVQPGDLKIVDQNRDGNISPDDKVIIGDPNPDFTFGFSSNFEFKKLTLDLFFNGVYGNDIVNGNLFRIGNANGLGNNNVLRTAYENAWTSENPTDYPRVGYDNLALIDSYVEDGSFLRLATATLGYTFKTKPTSKIKNCRLNLIGRNLWTLTNYSGFDPEVNSFAFDGTRIGVDWASYPNLRAYSVNLNLTF